MVPCRNCGKTQLDLILDLGMQPWGNDFIKISENRQADRYPLELLRCVDCAMVQIGHTLPKEVLFVDHHYMSGTTRSLTAHFDWVAGRILERLQRVAADYAVDIGGNDGTFLKCLVRRGMRVLNVESGTRQAERSSAAGVECLNEFFNAETAAKVLSDRGPARLIHGSGVFFHLEELHSVFEGVRALLAYDGLLVAQIIYLPEMIRNCAFDQIYHEHLLYYTLTTLGDLLGRHGLAIHDCEFAPIHGGSCIVYAGHAGRATASPACAEQLARERSDGFLDLPVYREFAVRTEALCEHLCEHIRAFRARGKRIFTLGAPVKGSTIVNYCGWTEREIECATEINELKCGTYVPGTRIPVVHQSAAGEPDLFVLLSWNFKDEILASLGDYRKNGGAILVPIPDAELI